MTGSRSPVCAHSMIFRATKSLSASVRWARPRMRHASSKAVDIAVTVWESNAWSCSSRYSGIAHAPNNAKRVGAERPSRSPPSPCLRPMTHGYLDEVLQKFNSPTSPNIRSSIDPRTASVASGAAGQQAERSAGRLVPWRIAIAGAISRQVGQRPVDGRSPGIALDAGALRRLGRVGGALRIDLGKVHGIEEIAEADRCGQPPGAADVELGNVGGARVNIAATGNSVQPNATCRRVLDYRDVVAVRHAAEVDEGEIDDCVLSPGQADGSLGRGLQGQAGDDADRMILDPDQRGVVLGGAQHHGAGIGAIPADLHEAVVVDVDFGIDVDAVGELDVALPDERSPAGAKGALRRAWPPGRALGIVNAVRRGMKLDGLWSGGRRRTHARQRHDEGAYQRCFDHHVTRWSGSAAWPQVAQYLGSTPIRAVMGFRQGSQQPALHLT